MTSSSADASAQADAWNECVQCSLDAQLIESALTKKRPHDLELLAKRAKLSLEPMKKTHLEWKANQIDPDLSDERIRSLSRFTDGLPLKPFERCLKLVPELVNLVSLADAIIVHGGSLPFDLRKIAQECGGSLFYSPRRFTAVQIAFAEPRCRVLLFHTGRIVGTGATSPTAAKMAILKAMRCISQATGLQIVTKRFMVINQVGASSILSRLDCDRFAATHTSSAHYDKASFVGLAFRPTSEACCSEIYSTGKTNLPGSRRERDLLRSWSRMAPELQRYSTKPELAELWPPLEREWHRAVRPSAASSVVWDDGLGPGVEEEEDLADDVEGADLNELFEGVF